MPLLNGLEQCAAAVVNVLSIRSTATCSQLKAHDLSWAKDCCLTFGSKLAASSAVLTVRYNAAGGLPDVLKSPAAQLSLLSSTWLRWYVRAGNIPLPESLRKRSGLDVQAMMLQAYGWVRGWVGGWYQWACCVWDLQ